MGAWYAIIISLTRITTVSVTYYYSQRTLFLKTGQEHHSRRLDPKMQQQIFVLLNHIYLHLEFPPQMIKVSRGNSVNRIACESRTLIRISDWAILKSLFRMRLNFISNSYSIFNLVIIVVVLEIFDDNHSILEFLVVITSVWLHL